MVVRDDRDSRQACVLSAALMTGPTDRNQERRRKKGYIWSHVFDTFKEEVFCVIPSDQTCPRTGLIYLKSIASLNLNL